MGCCARAEKLTSIWPGRRERNPLYSLSSFCPAIILGPLASETVLPFSHSFLETFGDISRAVFTYLPGPSKANQVGNKD